MTESLPPVTRRPIHTRQTITHGFLRSDGLWDMEGEVVDTKTYVSINVDGGRREIGEPFHHMRIILTMDDTLTVREARATMPNAPFPECPLAADPVRRMVGACVSSGWRKSVDAAMGDVRGCTHLRELLNAMATAALQTIYTYRSQERRERGEPTTLNVLPNAQMGKCMTWDTDGPLVARLTPAFIGYRPPARR